MSIAVLRSDAAHLPLADDSVDLVVTSPPYFGLRSYQDGGQHYDGQVGDEATPAEFLDALVACTAEWMRVLKPSGSMWVNLGDKYAQAEERSRNGNGNRVAIDGFTGGKPLRDVVGTVSLGRLDNGVPRKSLIGIPWRYALRCIDDLGLILRAEVIWSKPNGLPESVTDRVRRSHEQWFHMTLQPRYFSAVDEIREEYAPGTAQRYAAGYNVLGGELARLTTGYTAADGGPSAPNPLGKLPGSVWTVPTEPLRVPEHLGVDHFAAFPSEFPRRLILGWSPSGVCVECGEGRRPLTVTDLGIKERETPAYIGDAKVSRHGMGATTLGSRGPSATITGYACACGSEESGCSTTPKSSAGHTQIASSSATADRGAGDGPSWKHSLPLGSTRPAVVLDPFGGTGTTAHVAHALGRHGISVDLSHDYSRLAAAPDLRDHRWRKIHDLAKPPPVLDGQGDLFSEPA